MKQKIEKNNQYPESKDSYTLFQVRQILISFFSENEQMIASDIKKIVESQDVSNKFALQCAIEISLEKLCEEKIIHKLKDANHWIINKRFYELSTDISISYGLA